VSKLFRNLCETVVRCLKDVFLEHRYADKVIENAFRHNKKLGARDRRFIAENTYDMIRWWRLICDVGKVREVKDESDIWKLFGTWCVLNEWELPEWPQLKGIDKEGIMTSYSKLKKIRRVRESIPDWMDELCSRELGERQWEKELAALNEEARVVLRVNTLKIAPAELVKRFEKLEIGCETVPGLKEALVMEKRMNVFRYPEFKEGFFEVQDASSQMVGQFLDVKPGMRVIDACAGAGGKTLQLAALMQNKGRIVAMDPEQWKLDELKKRARRAGAGNIDIRLIDSAKVVKRLEDTADRLLLDVPCSGLGVLRRNPDAKWKLSPAFISKVQEQQRDILEHYPVMLKKGGVMVYSTCSILPSENHLQVQAFLDKHAGEYELLREDTLMPSRGFDGFYMAAIRKK
jgi:16S rRNA (cytosine967-C5)-methyltransferase